MSAVTAVSTRSTSSTRQRSLNFARIAIHVTLFILAVIWLVPTVGLLITSFRPREAIADSGWWTAFAPARFTLENYELVLNAQGMGDSFLNSFKITLPSTIIPIFLASLAAYSLAWIEFKGRNALLMIIIALLVIPIQTTLVPVLRLFNQFGINGSFAGIWLAHTAYGMPFAIYLLRNFFASLPRELLESAKMDGATEWTVFFASSCHSLCRPLHRWRSSSSCGYGTTCCWR